MTTATLLNGVADDAVTWMVPPRRTRAGIGAVTTGAPVVLAVSPDFELPVLVAEDAALRVCAIGVTQCRDEDHVGVRRVDDHLADVACVFEAFLFPCRAAIDGPVDAIAPGGTLAVVGFTGAGPDDVRAGSRDCDRADGHHADDRADAENDAERREQRAAGAQSAQQGRAQLNVSPGLRPHSKPSAGRFRNCMRRR